MTPFVNDATAQDDDLGPSTTTTLAVSPDGTRIALGRSPSRCIPMDATPEQWAEAAIRILNADTGEEITHIKGPECPVNDLDWSSDGTQLAVSEDALSIPWTYNFDTRQFHSPKGYGGIGGPESSGVDWSQDNQYIVNFSRDIPSVSIFDSTDFKLVQIHTDDPDRISAIDVNKDNYLAIADSEPSVEIWKIEPISSPERITKFNFATNALAWNPAGDQLALGIEDILIISPPSDSVLTTLRGHTDVIIEIKWSPDGQLLASGGLDNTIRIWNPITGKELAQYPVTTEWPAFDWSPDSKKFIYAVEEPNKLVVIVDAPLITSVFHSDQLVKPVQYAFQASEVLAHIG